MGMIDQEDRISKGIIRRALARRGLVPNFAADEWEVLGANEWEVHGPHRGMDYQVFIGWGVVKDDPEDAILVAIYPRAVYEIEDESKWWDVGPEDRIPTIEKKPLTKEKPTLK